MKRTRFLSFGVVSALLAILFMGIPTAQAGPPLVCHPYDIGGAKSLPWTADLNNLKGIPDYDISRLAEETLELLKPGTPVIVRMETLRRAALYARKEPRAEKELLMKLKARATDAQAKGKSDALAWFDMGYFAETLKQADMTFQKNANGTWDPVYAQNAATGIDGYALVKNAIAMRGQDSEMEFAAAVIASFPKQKSHDEHLRKAVAGATEGSLLARNLVSHYGDQGKTIAELRLKLGSK